MIKTVTRTVLVRSVERMDSSENGNPRWKVISADGAVLKTKPDSTVGYQVTHGWERMRFLLTLEGGQIVAAEELQERR